MSQFDYEKLRDPSYFKEGCVKPHSDHVCYASVTEREYEETSLRHSLNGVWYFHYANNYAETVKGFERDDFSCRDFSRIRVPAHIQLEGYDAPQYVNVQYPWEGHEELKTGELPERFNPVASYVKYFTLPSHMEKERVCLVLEGAESAAAVWLNGNFVGYHEDSFTPAEFELTEYVREGENKLAVQVFKWASGSWCEDQDFFRFSGLYRDVYLVKKPKAHVEDLFITALPSEDHKEGNFSAGLRFEGKGRVKLSLHKDGKEVFSAEAEGENDLHFEAKIENPALWSAETPALYTLDIEAYGEDGSLCECIRERVGFRRFELKDGLMKLNGKRIVFKGANRHDFSSITGRAVSKEEVVKDLVTMKRNNINAVRTSHYPNGSLLYRLCDLYGLYVIDETNLETHGTWDYASDVSEILPRDKMEWAPSLIERAASMYHRDKNHPSILIWSCGNESHGGQVIFEMSEYFRKNDPTRLVHYEGVHMDRRFPATSDMESRMYVGVQGIEEYLKEHPEKPYLLCEYTHAMGNSCGGMSYYTDLAERNEKYQGGFIWDYVDQSIEMHDRYGVPYQAYGGDFGDRPSDYQFSGNGIAHGGSREASPKMQEVKFLYQNIKVTFTENEVEIKNRNLFVNTGDFLCRLTLEKEGKVLSKIDMETDVKPLETKRYPILTKLPERAGEYVLTVSFHLKKEELWAEAGHEIAFGQKVFTVEETEKCCECKEERPLEVIRSPHVTGVRGENFELLFSKQYGELISYKYGGKELFVKNPKPNFWRAPVDNDCGNLMQARYAEWKIASLYAGSRYVKPGEIYAGMDPFTLEEKDGKVIITCTNHLPTTPRASVEIKYTVYPSGKVKTELTYDPVKELHDMPEFGMLFTLDADYDRLTWYGLGPMETYVDRKRGGKLSVYRNTVRDNMVPYLVPQECGNKEEVRYAKVTDKKGRGILFQMEKENGPMCFSALPYTPHQIEEAMHHYELPNIHRTVIRVAKAQMGVAGDDSWGSRVKDEHLINVGEKLHFAFSFQGI